MPQTPARGDFYIGAWLIRPSLNQVVDGDAVHRLAPRFMQVLLGLAEHPGHVVERGDLLKRAWGDVYVDDVALSQAISRLRKVFGDDPKQPCYIETIPKRGYRLIAPVTFEAIARSTPAVIAPQEVLLWSQPRIWRVFGAGVLGVVLVALVLNLTARSSSVISGPQLVIPVTTAPGLDLDPALSPDGTEVAFSRREQGQSVFNLYVQVVGAALPLQLTDTDADDVNPTWSPDGRLIAFVRLKDGKCSLLLMPVPGGPARKVAPCGNESQPTLAWHPDGSKLAVSDREGRGHPYYLKLFALDTWQAARVTTPAETMYGDTEPAFSPDGETLAFTRLTTSKIGEVYTVAADGTGLQQWTNDQASLRGVDWAMDGKTLIFASTRRGRLSLWAGPRPRTTPQWLGVANAYTPSTARQQARMVYARLEAAVDIWRFDRDAPATVDTLQPIIVSSQADRSPQFSPDGTQIAFISTRSGYPELWITDADGNRPTQVTQYEGAIPNAPYWSPDGQNLVFEVQLAGATNLYRVAAQGGQARRLTDHAAQDATPRWSRTGDAIYFGSDRTGDWQLWRIDADGQNPTALGQAGRTAQEAPDGATLYYTRPDTSGLWRLDLATGIVAPSSVVKLAREDGANWQVHDEGLYFMQRFPTAVVAFYNFATRLTTPVTSAPEQEVPQASFSVDPSQQHILFDVATSLQGDIMLLEDV